MSNHSRSHPRKRSASLFQDPARLTLTKKITPLSSSPLSLLAQQPSHYISALVLGRRYQLTSNDILTVPHMKGVKPGDRIRLTRILEVGSRDFTLRAVPESTSAADAAAAAVANGTSTSNVLEALKGAASRPLSARPLVRENGVPRDWQRHPDSLPYFRRGEVECELVVLEHTKGKMFQVEKFKRRKGYRR